MFNISSDQRKLSIIHTGVGVQIKQVSTEQCSNVISIFGNSSSRYHSSQHYFGCKIPNMCVK